MGCPRTQQTGTQTLLLVAVWKPDGKGRVADGEVVMVHIVSGLTSRDGEVRQELTRTVLLLENIQAAKPEALCATRCWFFSFSGRGPKKGKWRHPGCPAVASGAGARSGTAHQDGIRQQLQPVHPRATESRVSAGTVLLSQIGRRKRGWFLSRTAHQKHGSVCSGHKWLRPVQTSSEVFSATPCC